MLKIKICLAVLLLPFSALLGQDITGRWEGVFQSDLGMVSRKFIIRFEVVQVDKMVYGAFSNRAEGDKTPAVLYTISGEVDKKDSSQYRLIKEKVEETSLPDNVAEAFLEFRLQYEYKDSVHILSGRWFPDGATSRRIDGAAGLVYMRRVTTDVSPVLHDWLVVRRKMKERQ